MRKKRKVFLLVSNDLLADRRVEKMALMYRDLGLIPHLIGRNLGLTYPASDFEITRYRCWVNTGPLFYIELNIRLFLGLLFERNMRVLVANDTDTLMAAGLLRFFKKMILVYDAHEYFEGVPELQGKPWIRWIWRTVEHVFIPLTDIRITVSESVRQLLLTRGFERFRIVRNVPVAQRLDMNIEPVHKSTFNILYPGMINPGRGLEVLIEALTMVPEDVVLTIMGRGQFKTQLEEQVRELGLENRVVFTGAKPYSEVQKALSETDLGVVLEQPEGASFQAALPNKVFDFMHFGIPVLYTSALPEVCEVMKQVPFGLEVRFSPGAVAQGIKDMMENPGGMQEMRKKALECAPNFTWENEVRKLRPELEGLIN